MRALHWGVDESRMKLQQQLLDEEVRRHVQAQQASAATGGCQDSSGELLVGFCSG
jgi:hypothetical protein